MTPPFRTTPGSAGGNFTSIRARLTEYGGVEWQEVVHPTRTRPLDALRMIPCDHELLARATWS